MTDKPIIFSTPMVQALLAGRKTQTRRIVKPSPGAQAEVRLPYAPGDRLWVRETHAFVPSSAYRASEGVTQRIDPTESDRAAIYRASFDRSQGGIRWRPSIHMPRWASRLTLTVTDVQVQRLQEISDRDAEAEGCASQACGGCGLPKPYDNCIGCHHEWFKPAFRELWDSIYGEGAWNETPWVFAVTFEVGP